MRHCYLTITIIAIIVSFLGCTEQSKPSAPRAPDYLAKDEAPAKPDGMKLYNSRGCNVCHSVDGRQSIGPTFKGLYDSEVVLESGKKVKADEKYLRESILNPNVQVRKGYPAVMPKQALNDDEVSALIAFIQSLGSAGKATQK